MSPYKLISQLNYSSYRKENLDYWPFNGNFENTQLVP